MSQQKDVTEANLIAYFHASAHSRLVTLKMAYRMQLALAKLCGRARVPERFPASWRVVQPKLDNVLTWHWQQKESQDTFVDRGTWSQSNKEAVFALMDKADFEACHAASVAKTDCPGANLARILQTSLGQALFHAEARQYQMHQFIDRCHKRANDLLHTSFSDESVQGYRDAAPVEIRVLTSSGHKLFDKSVKRQLSFLNLKVEVFPTSVYDIKDWILSATARSMAISNGQLPRLPWEATLYGDEPLPHFGSTVQVPLALIEDAINVRKMIARIAGEWAPGRTLKAMQEAIGSNQKDILETDRSAALEIGFLFQCVHGVANGWVTGEVLQMLADAEVPNSVIPNDGILKCVMAVKKLQSDRRYSCLPSATADDIVALISLLSSMLEGPAHAVKMPTAGTSRFLQQALDAIATWLKIPDVPQKKKAKVVLPPMLQGQAAANQLFKKLEALPLDHRSSSDLVLLRNFKWLLGPHSRDVLDSWVEDLVRSTRAAIVTSGMIADGPAKSVPAPAAEGSSSARSSSSISAGAVQGALLASKSSEPASKKLKTSQAQAVSKEKMMKVCCGKS